MDKYLGTYGWHFSKAMCMWAVSMMRDRNGNKLELADKDHICELMKKYGEEIDSKGYDAVYLYHMIKADYWGSSITSESQLCKHIADISNDKDGYDGMVFTRFYADMIAKGEPIIWEDLL